MVLSIVVVSWNTRELLAQCLDSIYAQSPEFAFDVWVVDNASSDGSAAMVRERFPQARLIENRENVGFARANNQAMSVARSRYILLLNSDASLPADALTRLVSFMDKVPCAGMVGPLYVNADGTFQASFADFPRLGMTILDLLGILRRWLGPHFPSKGPNESLWSRSVDWVPGTCMLVRAATIADVGLLDEGFFFYSEEVDWCYRMWQREWEIWFCPEVVVTHHLGQSARKVAEARIWHLYRGKLRFFAKHHGNLQAKVLKSSMVLALVIRVMILFLVSFVQQEEHQSWRACFAVASRMMSEPTSFTHAKASATTDSIVDAK